MEELKAREAAARERLGEVNGKLGNLLAAVEDGLSGSSVQVRLQEPESKQALLKGELADTRMRRNEIETHPIEVEQAAALFGMLTELFGRATREEKEALADAVLKCATVPPDRSVEFEIYVGADPNNVAQNVKFGRAGSRWENQSLCPGDSLILKQLTCKTLCHAPPHAREDNDRSAG